MPFGGPGSYRRQGAPSIEQILVQFNTSSVNFPCSPPRTSFPVEDPHQGADPRCLDWARQPARAATPARRSIELYIQLSPK